MIGAFGSRRVFFWAVFLLSTVVTGCGALRSATTPPPSFYSLDLSRADTPYTDAASTHTLLVSVPQAASGYDSQRIIYLRQAHGLEYFAHSEWIDTPARMLAPMIIATIQDSGTFRAVIPAPSSARGDLRLDTEIIRLHQDFRHTPSRVRFTLRARLIDGKTQHVVASHEFDDSSPAPSDDPYGGIVAANRVVRMILDELAVFCAQASLGTAAVR
jgi:cholesterol transport system auxiliary component